MTRDNQFEPKQVFDVVERWTMLGRASPSDVITVRDRIDVENPEWKRVAYKWLVRANAACITA